MRYLAFTLFVCAVFAVGAVVLAISAGREGFERYDTGPDFHPPETADERAAASVGLAYARAMARDDVDAACALTGGAAARRLRCGTSRARVRPCGGHLTVHHAKLRGERANVIVGGCTLELLRNAGRWRVVGDQRVGFA